MSQQFTIIVQWASGRTERLAAKGDAELKKRKGMLDLLQREGTVQLYKVVRGIA